MPTVLITGSAKRIGLEIALFFANKGYDIAMHCNKSAEDAKKRADEIQEKYNTKCKVFACDLSKPELIKPFFDRIIHEFKTVDILINNASTFTESTITDVTLEHLTYNFAIHFLSPTMLSQVFSSQQNIQDGIIINILDKNITRARTKYFAYLHSKKALWDLTKYLAVVLAPKIRTNAISPGFILPEETSKADEYYIQNKLSSIPMRKQGCAKNILQGIQYIIENDYVNGQNLFIDGGSFLLND